MNFDFSFHALSGIILSVPTTMTFGANMTGETINQKISPPDFLPAIRAI
jgi:hypothetical protein